MPEDYHTTDRSNDCLLDSDGNLLDDYAEVIETGARLCVLPIARTHLEWSALTFPGGITFYPPGHVDLDILNVVPNRGDSKSLAESCSAASGVTEETLANHTLVVFPCRFDWDKVLHNSHNNHLDFIRKLSEHIDQTCLNLIRYRQCPIDKVDCLPGRAGQLESNHMMSGALLYRHEKREAKIIGGAAFSLSSRKGSAYRSNQFRTTTSPRTEKSASLSSTLSGNTRRSSKPKTTPPSSSSAWGFWNSSLTLTIMRGSRRSRK